MSGLVEKLIVKPIMLWVNRTAYAVKETVRIRGPLVSTVNLVCGITLSLVLLLGLKNGLVRQQERDVLRSPSAIVIGITSSQTSQSLSPRLIGELEALPGVEQVIEDITKIVSLKGTTERTGVTVRCTRPGDPLLKFYHADVLQPGQKAIVISSALADATEVKYRNENNVCHVDSQQSLTMTVTRQEGTETGTATIKLNIAGVVALGSRTPLAFLHRDLLNDIEDFQMGRRVEAHDWPGFARSAVVSYTEYLMFSKGPATSLDLMKLKANGLTSRRLDATKPDDEQLRTLASCLKPENLFVSSLTADGGKLLTRDPQEIENITDTDDVVVGWSPPLEDSVSQATLIGLTVQGRWLRKYFSEPALPFADNKDELVLNPMDQALAQVSEWELRLPATKLTLRVLPDTNNGTTTVQPPLAGVIQSLQQNLPQVFGPATIASSDPSVTTAMKPVWQTPFKAVVPAALLSHLHAAKRGDVEFDPSTRMFVDASRDNACFQGRVIVSNIHAVPAVDDLLTQRGFATQSQRVRVQELQSYAKTLQLLVFVAGGILAYAGLSTLTTTFWQETNRKARFMAELIAMGARPMTIAYVVLVRGLLIGAVSGAVTIGLSKVVAPLLTKHVAECIVETRDVQLIALAALVAGGIGSLLPALRALMIEPAEIIREGAGN